MTETGDVKLKDRSVYAMSITPFTEGGDLDEALLRAHLQYLAGGRVGVFLCSQGSGEGDLLTSDEKARIYEIGVDELGGKTAVCAAGIGLAGTTQQIADLARRAAAAGVDGIYVLAPRPSPMPMRSDEIDRYYRTVIEAVDCPVILSNNAFLAGYTVPLDVFERLVHDYDHVEAVLLVDGSGGATSLLAQYIERLGDRVLVWSGAVVQVLTAYAVGARGVLCMEPNVVPDVGTVIWEALEAGDERRAAEGFRRLLQLNAPIARHANPRSLKEALRVVGRDGGHLREPYLALPEAQRADLEASLKALGL
jgi:4-hydroxy-tetrahydrodipicolinate synthase